jgi:hypothetical protein
MASLASELSQTQVTELLGRLGRFGLTSAHVKKLNGDDDLVEQFVKVGLTLPAFALIHGVFTPTVDVLAAFKARCAAKGIDFGNFSWVGPETAPDFDPNDPETVVVLDATLGTLKQTFEFAWEWTVDGQEDKWRYEGMDSDPEKLTLLDGLEFKPWTLSWVRIKLDTNVGKKPIDVRDPKSSPGCALLFMGAEHPARIKATDYEKRFGFWLPGLKCTAPDEEQWRNVPCVYFYRGYRQVGLYSGWVDRSRDGLAVPSFRE